jgi:hypothetical protein
MINYAISHEMGTAMVRSREAIRVWIKGHIIVKHGAPPMSARLYARQLLRLCLARGTRLVKKIVALKLLPNGDWRNQRGIEIYVPIGANVDIATIGDVVADGVCMVALGDKLKKIYKDRWHGADLAWDQFVRLEGICGIASNTFPSFLESLTGKRVRPITHGFLYVGLRTYTGHFHKRCQFW